MSVGALITWPYKAGGRSRRESPMAGTTVFGTSASNINRLQRLQNSVARLVTRQAGRDSAMPLLRELHWLPVRRRVSYKIDELTFKALHVDLSPADLQQCVQVYTVVRYPRSASSYTLVQNRSRCRACGCHSLECDTYFRRL